MKADFTRNTFHPRKHFTRVLMQQGRVQLDADWNEQAAILTRYLRSLAADIIGSHGGPNANLGFSILPLQYSQTVGNDFAISDGHYYVDGVLCENDSTPVAIFAPQDTSPNSLSVTVEVWTIDGVSFQNGQYLQIFDAANPTNLPPPIPPNKQQNPLIALVSNAKQASRSLTLTADPVGIGWINTWINLPNTMPRVRHFLTYTTQPDYPGQAKLSKGTYHVYLDVWERLITTVEDDSIREVALGGPDTAARAKLIAQVKVTQDPSLPPDPAACATPMALSALFQPYSRGLLKARVRPSAASMDPCIISPTSSYRGPENQLYRVEIHTGTKDALGNAAVPTFKWSREDGSVMFPILGGFGSTVLTLETLGRDDRFGLAEGDWVEAQDDDYVLLNRAGTLLQVLSIDRSDMQVTLNAAADPATGKDPSKHPLLRRWDQKQGDEADVLFGTKPVRIVGSNLKTEFRSSFSRPISRHLSTTTAQETTGSFPLAQPRVTSSGPPNS